MAPSNTTTEDEQQHISEDDATSQRSSALVTGLKLVAAAGFLLSALNGLSSQGGASAAVEAEGAPHRRLLEVDETPSYMGSLLKDLKERKKLFEETPPEEVKYWFEYTGALQKYFYRFSRSRGKADYFEGRDDSGVVSARFVEEAGGGEEYEEFFLKIDEAPTSETKAHIRLLENCLSMGSPARPNTSKGSLWNDWFGSSSNPSGQMDRCRILFTMNTVGAGRGTTLLWETNPPPIAAQGPKVWQSEQETAASHMERNLQEINSMCATGQIAARVQMLVCEPIPAKWTEWMDSMLVNCGGKPPKPMNEPKDKHGGKVEERASPVQIVVVASASTADTCHDLKSGFMERRMQDLVLAPPYLGDEKNKHPGSSKTTHPDLISSDDHDLYVALKWSSLVTIRSVNSFLQASADLAAAASSPANQKPSPEQTADGSTVAISNSPSSPFLIPSFVRMSYVSEENSKVAKWRMHGDFFHPASWEICKDSFDMTWIPDSLSGAGGVKTMCSASSSTARRLASEEECGQWWVFFAELQMPTTPEVYANEAVAPLVEGGSNFFWMVTERQRREMVKGLMCNHEKSDVSKCPKLPQAVMPLGDLESFFINFTPNTALGKKHTKGRRPGYSKEQEREMDRERVKERKQLHDQEDIEKALFDYTIYPAALFRKDATIMAARARDLVLTKNKDDDALGPQTVKSSYYDVTITKPREPVLGWCQAIARKGLCTLYADYFRSKKDERCLEACGLKKNWSKIEER